MKYLWSPDGALLAQAPLASTDKQQTQQAVTDGMNSVYQVLDNDLVSLAQYKYSAFGERTLASGADVSAMGFTSEQHDDSGLIYLRYRYYDPSVGQFISMDPAVTQTLDAYGYASGNPLQMSDPLGLWTWKDTNDVLGTINTWATYIGIAAAGIALVPETGGFSIGGAAAGISTVAGYTALGASTFQTGYACWDGFNQECGWGFAGVALGRFGVSKTADKILNKARKRIPLPAVLTAEDFAEWNAKTLNARMAHGGLNSSYGTFDLLNKYCNPSKEVGQ